MIQLSLPIRVTPASCAVPQLKLQYSRIVLRSPISSAVGSPPYFLSWGGPPSELNPKMRFPAPMRVRPSITTCGPIEVPSPRSGGSYRAQRAQDLRFGGERVADARLRSELPQAAGLPLERHLEQQLVARDDRPLEARLVDSREVVDGPVVRFGAERPERQYGRGLSQRLDDHDPGHDRLVREMAGKERLVDGDVLDREEPLARLAFEHPIHQKHGIAVRQVLQDLADVHRLPLFLSRFG